jgi:hypothetical protein
LKGANVIVAIVRTRCEGYFKLLVFLLHEHRLEYLNYFLYRFAHLNLGIFRLRLTYMSLILTLDAPKLVLNLSVSSFHHVKFRLDERFSLRTLRSKNVNIRVGR